MPRPRRRPAFVDACDFGKIEVNERSEPRIDQGPARVLNMSFRHTPRPEFLIWRILETRNHGWRHRLVVYSGLVEVGGELDVFGTCNADVEIIRGRAELAKRKLPTLGPACVDAILRYIDQVVSYVKSNDGVIDAVV